MFIKCNGFFLFKNIKAHNYKLTYLKRTKFDYDFSYFLSLTNISQSVKFLNNIL